MRLHSTPEMLEAAYELLRATPPFKRWKLPASDDVEFHVTRIPGCYGYLHCNVTTKTYIIKISHEHIPHVTKMLATMAHEMCHMRQHLLEPNRPVAHGPKFKRLAAQVCRHHGFDAATF